jgi:D-alanine transaminase
LGGAPGLAAARDFETRQTALNHTDFSTMTFANLTDQPCYLNGAYTPLNEAKVSVMDRGFIFGDGVYEVLSVYGGRVFRFEQHMQRLERSLAELRIHNPHSRAQWLEIATTLIAKYAVYLPANGQNDVKDHLIYLQVTRGVAMRDHVMPQGIQPTVFGNIGPMPSPSALARAQGVACVSADDFRWQKAHIKSTSLLGSVFARQIAADADAVETVMFRGDFLSEGAASNVWIVKDGVVLGPKRNHLVLEGIRYGLIEEICHAQAVLFELRNITRQEVLNCDEMLLSSATKEVLPVTRLDGKALGNGRPGPIYDKLYAAYQRAKAAA